MRLGGGRIFVITSGMMTEKTAAHELATRMVGDDKHAIYFVGYADPDSPGGKLRAATHGQTFVLSPSAGEVTKNCEVDSFDLTAHANREELLDFVDVVSPKTVILGHGDEDAKAWFAEQIRAKHPKIKVLVPEPGQMMEV
jgi:Cft2 family RNA processing exonuclease